MRTCKQAMTSMSALSLKTNIFARIQVLSQARFHYLEATFCGHELKFGLGQIPNGTDIESFDSKPAIILVIYEIKKRSLRRNVQIKQLF